MENVQTEVNNKVSYLAKKISDAGSNTTHAFRKINSKIVTKYLELVNVCIKSYKKNPFQPISPHFNPLLFVSFIDF